MSSWSNVIIQSRIWSKLSKGYAGHEHKVFKEVIEAHYRREDAYGVGEQIPETEGSAGQVLRQLLPWSRTILN